MTPKRLRQIATKIIALLENEGITYNPRIVAVICGHVMEDSVRCAIEIEQGEAEEQAKLEGKARRAKAAAAKAGQ